MAATNLDDACLRADRLALSLRAGRERIDLPLARAARAFTRRKGWFAFGHARLEDHARERFFRSGRWVRDLAALGEALATLPGLADALTGDDGGPPLGTVAVRCIGRVATAASLQAWVDLARRVTVRDLRDAIRDARKAVSSWPPGARGRGDVGAEPHAPPARTGSADSAPERDGAGAGELTNFRLQVPPAVRAAFDEALDLYRAIVGCHATVTSFIEALVAESAAGEDPPDLEAEASRRRPARAAREQVLARSTGNWRHLPQGERPSTATLQAAATLASLDELAARAGFGGPAELDAQLRGLLKLQAESDRQLGCLLADMSQQDAWRRLSFSGVGHYGEERLRLSRTTAEDTARLARAFQRFPHLRDAHRQGRVGPEAALLVARILGREPVEEEFERSWVRRAEEVTVKRLRDEARLLARREVLPPPVDASQHPKRSPHRRPPTDAEWHASLRREPGLARRRVEELGQEALPWFNPNVFRHDTGPGTPNIHSTPAAFRRGRCSRPAEGNVSFLLRLPATVASDFQASLWSFRGRLSRLTRELRSDDAGAAAGVPPSLLAALDYSQRHLPLPGWVAFLALLEEFVDQWDDPRAMTSRPGDRVYARDGWRCTAPGCTSRRNLEDHHVVYRSRGGDDDLSNRTCLCRFHHQRGEHDDLASCRGVAPLGLVWRLGRPEFGERFRGERRLGTAGA